MNFLNPKSQHPNYKQNFKNQSIKFQTIRFAWLEPWNLELPFDSFDHEAPDRLAQGGESFNLTQDREPVERLVEPFVFY